MKIIYFVFNYCQKNAVKNKKNITKTEEVEKLLKILKCKKKQRYTNSAYFYKYFVKIELNYL